MDKKIISIYMGNPDNSNHAELELPATPWELVDAMDKLRLSEGQEPYWQVEDMGRYEFLAPHLDGYDLYQLNALAEKLRTFGDVDAVAFEGLVQMELNNLYQNNGDDLTLRRVLDLAYSVDCCHVVPGITDDAARWDSSTWRTIFSRIWQPCRTAYWKCWTTRRSADRCGRVRAAYLRPGAM